jgi:hypothetical protein
MGTYSNKSSYIIVKNTVPTVGYFDNDGFPKAEYRGSLPTPSSGSFSGGSGSPYSSTSPIDFKFRMFRLDFTILVSA